jgi:hypothetical protein
MGILAVASYLVRLITRRSSPAGQIVCMAHCDFEDFEVPRMKINPLPDLGIEFEAWEFKYQQLETVKTSSGMT